MSWPVANSSTCTRQRGAHRGAQAIAPALAAITVARERRGTQFDPQVVDIFAAEAASLFADLDEVNSWDAVIGAEPALGTWVAGPEFDAALEAIADFTDVKSPYTIGHSRAVADLAGEAARIF